MKGLALWLALWPGSGFAACRHALVLALDISASVDAGEYRQQLDGVATALTAPSVREILLQQGAAPVRLAVFEWSDPAAQRQIVPWTALTGDAALADVVTRLSLHRRSPGGGSTGIGPAMEHGFALLAEQPECWRHTLDISGDGAANAGVLPQRSDAFIAPPGTIVNALVVGASYLNPDPLGNTDLTGYFEGAVIRGEGAFVERATGYHSYAETMERKLVRELQSLALTQAQ